MATRSVDSHFTLRFPHLPRTGATRKLILATGDVVLWGFSCWLAFLIRFDGRIPSEYIATIPLVLIAIIPTKLAWFAMFRLYQVTWRLVGITEVIPLGQASTFATLTLAGGFLLLREFPAFGTFPRSVLILDYLVGTAFVTLFRLSPRLLGEFSNGRGGRSKGVRVLLVGAGAAGERVAPAT